jgi:hypothetical protein
MGPWESVPAMPQREPGGGGRTGGGAGHSRAGRGSAGGQQGVMPRSRAGAMASGLRRPFRTLMRRADAEMGHLDALLRRHAPCCAAHRSPRPWTRHILQPRKQERQPTCAACPNLAATAVSLSLAPCQFRLDSCVVIGFVSQFFSSTSGPLSSTGTLGRPSSCADDGRVGAQRWLPRAKAHGWLPSHLAISGMTIGVLRAKEPWLTGATGQDQATRSRSGQFSIS